MDDEPGTHVIGQDGRVYVLRVWYEPHDAALGPQTRHWRASLREGTHGERRHFATVDECIEHLYGELVRR
ncbi:hypothetical protein [Deinococcus sonorensis]|uniref:Uncharacterized protein n=2 Tax=Deinococcus sonorensis TaxID=309891 RepID=A0AAU7U9I6_9DEIO